MQDQIEHIGVVTKWQPFCRQHLQSHFLTLKLYFEAKFTKSSSRWSKSNHREIKSPNQLQRLRKTQRFFRRNVVRINHPNVGKFICQKEYDLLYLLSANRVGYCHRLRWYKFLIFGLSYLALIEFARAFFLLVYGLLTLLLSCKSGLVESRNNGNNNSDIY